MNEVNRIINECGLSKVKVAKYLGVSRQMLYNYLALKSMDELPKDKYNKILKLFNATTENELEKIKVDQKFLEELDIRLNDGIVDLFSKESMTDLKGLNKKEQELLTDIFNMLKEKLTDDGEGQNNNGYNTLRYLYHFIQAMEQVDELKYLLAYMSKSNGVTSVNEFIYDEEKQFIFEGILYSAMTLYTNGGASRNKVTESHKKFEQDIESKKEEKLSRTQELNSFKALALQELGYTSINETNAKEVFEKIAEIMSRKF